MKNFRWLVLFCGLGWLGTGCMTMPKMLPAAYFAPVRTISVEVSGCPATPALRTDQPSGNIAQATWLTRQQAMQNRMKNITPDRIQQAVRDSLARQLAGTFTVVDQNAQLALKVSLTEWGWFVPTGTFGESTDIHYFRLEGRASILDQDPAQNGQEVYFTYNSTDTPLGDHITKEKCEATLPKAADDFAAQVVRFILKGKAP